MHGNRVVGLALAAGLATAPARSADKVPPVMVMEFRGSAEPALRQACQEAAVEGARQAVAAQGGRVTSGDELAARAMAAGADDQLCATLACQLRTLQALGGFRYAVVGEVMDVAGDIHLTVKLLDVPGNLDEVVQEHAQATAATAAATAGKLAMDVVSAAVPAGASPKTTAAPAPQPRGTLLVVATKLDGAKQFSLWWGPNQSPVWDVAARKLKDARPYQVEGASMPTTAPTGLPATTEAQGLVTAANAVDLVVLQVVGRRLGNPGSAYELELRSRRYVPARQLFGEEAVGHANLRCDPLLLDDTACRNEFSRAVTPVLH